MKTIYKLTMLAGFLLMLQYAQGQEISNRQQLDEMAVRLRAEAEQDFATAKTKALEKGWSLDGLVKLDDRGNPMYVKSNNENAANLTGTFALRFFNGVTGSGLKMGIWEVKGVPLLSHQDFQSRITVKDGSVNTSPHATAVAGTLMGKPPGPIDSRGMAYDALLDAYDQNQDLAEMATAAASSTSDVAAGKLLISNHSYSYIAGWNLDTLSSGAVNRWNWYGDIADYIPGGNDQKFGRYGTEDETIDGIVRLAPYYLPVFASGNDGANDPTNSGFPLNSVRFGTSGDFVPWDAALHPDADGDGTTKFNTISVGSLGKNILTVGATEDVTLLATDFSSRGPTNDGRIKPEIVGMGRDLYTASDESDASYTTASGTSFATPQVAGSLLLLQELYRDLHPTGGDYNFMKAATLKALVINSATSNTDKPTYAEGFGRLNAFKAGSVIKRDAWVGGTGGATIIEDVIANASDTFVYKVRIKSGADFRVTLAYNDVPAATLINDLDLRIISSTGTERGPWILNPDFPHFAAGYADNDIDNVESYNRATMPSGETTILVLVEGSLHNNEPQPFSLVVFGIDSDCSVTINHSLEDLPSANYIATDEIISLAKLKADKSITYTTNGKIELIPGFVANAEATSGSGYFKTAVGGCP